MTGVLSRQCNSSCFIKPAFGDKLFLTTSTSFQVGDDLSLLHFLFLQCIWALPSAFVLILKLLSSFFFFSIKILSTFRKRFDFSAFLGLRCFRFWLSGNGAPMLPRICWLWLWSGELGAGCKYGQCCMPVQRSQGLISLLGNAREAF